MVVAKRIISGSLVIYITIVLLPQVTAYIWLHNCYAVLGQSMELSVKKVTYCNKQQKSERVTMVKKSDCHSKIVTVD